MVLKSIAKRQIRIKNTIPVKKCVVCGTSKVCLNFADYVYKINKRYCCSWTCYRKLQKEIEVKKEKHEEIYEK